MTDHIKTQVEKIIRTNPLYLENIMAKMKEYSKEYNKEAINLALSNIIIKQCKECGHPTIDGYCCTHCNSTDPTYSGQEESYIEV